MIAAMSNWLEGDDGTSKMSKCGFRIYKSYAFGIDGAGYDFYENNLPYHGSKGDSMLQWQYYLAKSDMITSAA